MSAARLLGRLEGLAGDLKGGDAVISPRVAAVISADAAHTLTVSQIAGGIIQFTGLTAGRNLTVPTAADLTAAFSGLDSGESVELIVSIITAFALTLVANTGTTLAGRATVVANTSQRILFTKTSATAWVARVL